MDINAVTTVKPNTGVTFQPDPGSASSSSSNDQRPPTLQSFDRWHEMPAEITYQVMQWLMLNEQSKSAPAAFAMTSKFLHQLGQAFRRNHLYEQTQSILLHPRLVHNSRVYLDNLGDRPRLLDCATPEKLIFLLDRLCVHEGKSGTAYLLKLENIPETTISDPGVLKALRTYKGEKSPLIVKVSKASRQRASSIAKTLPPGASLNLSLDSSKFKGKEFAELLGEICAGRQMTSIQLLDLDNATSDPEVRQALMNTLCGGGMVSHLVFDPQVTNDMLIDLTARFQEIRHLRLLSIHQVDTTYSTIQALMAAIEQRHASGQPRITVVLPAPDRLELPPDSIFSSKEKLLELESLGLFFGILNGSESADELVQKVHMSVGEGPVGNYLCHSRPTITSAAAVSRDIDENSSFPESVKKKIRQDGCLIS